MQPPAIIVSARFELIALEAEALHALIAGDTASAGRLVGVVFPSSWPDDEERCEGLPWHLGHLQRDPRHVGWRVRVVAVPHSRAVVGSVSLKGPPHVGDVEIGWAIDPEHRRQGYGYEAASALKAWALNQTQVRALSATIDDQNLASGRLAVELRG